MVKTLDEDSKYEPSKRSFKWLKLKNDYMDRGLGDTFDLVPIGAVMGTGKRVGTYGTYLMASYNSQKELYETCTLVATGFSDKVLKELTETLSQFVIKEPQDDYSVPTGQTLGVSFFRLGFDENRKLMFGSPRPWFSSARQQTYSYLISTPAAWAERMTPKE